MEHIDLIAQMMVADGSGAASFFAFELNETTGLTLYDTGNNPNGRTATIDGSVITLDDLGSGERGIDFANTTHSGSAISPNGAIVGSGLQRTIEAQFYIDSTAGEFAVLCALQAIGANELMIVYSTNTGYKLTVVYALATPSGTRTQDSMTRDRWVHLVVTLDGTSIEKIRLDGVIQTTENSIGWFPDSNTSRLGNYSNPGAAFAFVGKQNYLRVYDTLMSDEETLELYNNRPMPGIGAMLSIGAWGHSYIDGAPGGGQEIQVYIEDNTSHSVDKTGGTPGAILATLNSGLDAYLAAGDYDQVILMGGLNDIGVASSDDSTAWAALVESMCDKVVAAGAIPIVIGPGLFKGYVPYWTADRQTWSDNFNAKLTTLTTTNGWDFVELKDSILADDIDPDRFETIYDSGDHIHPSDLGYEWIGAQIVTIIDG